MSSDFLKGIECVPQAENIKKWVVAHRIEETFWRRNPWQ
jgi:hypothetical protein